MGSSAVRGFDYAALLRGSLIGLVRGLIERVAEDGFPGDHHFLLTFGTHEPGVEMSASLRKRFPEEITIVLQYQFWNLTADDEGFKVTLRFGGQPERLVVPWPALRGFADPSCDFGLRLQAPPADPDRAPGLELAGDPEPLGPSEAAPMTAEAASEPGAGSVPETAAPNGGNVLAFSARRRKRNDEG